MGAKQTGLGIFIVILLCSATLLVLSPAEQEGSADVITFDQEDPLYQYEGHDHSNASQHIAGTDNI